jgi:hypothetical protein
MLLPVLNCNGDCQQKFSTGRLNTLGKFGKGMVSMTAPVEAFLVDWLLLKGYLERLMVVTLDNACVTRSP